MKKKIIRHDGHFNMFHSYAQGNEKNSESMEILEDNLTRAFLITLSYLESSQIIKFLNASILHHQDCHLPPISDTSGIDKIHFDLQNLSDKSLKAYVKKPTVQKILLTISPRLHKVFDSAEKEQENNTGGSRPDGWIILGDYAILIESKVNNNPLTENQLSRHIKTHFGVSKHHHSFSMVQLTWSKIIEGMNGLFKHDEHSDGSLKFTIFSQFREALMKSGQNLDLSFITDHGRGYNREDARNNFELLLSNFDEKIKSGGMTSKIKRGKRPKAGHIWDYYGYPNTSESIKMDPHYSVYFDIDGAGIAFTTKKITGKKNNQLTSIVNHIEFEKFLKKCLTLSKIELSQCYYRLLNYRQIDMRRGVQSGETFQTFSHIMNLSELKYFNDKNFEKNYEIIRGTLVSLAKHAKQFEFGYRFMYPNVEKMGNAKEESIRSMNLEIFKDEEKLIDKFYDFIGETFTLYKELVGTDE
jgi:hypothetical protein